MKRHRALRKRYGRRRGHAAWHNYDWLVLHAIAGRHGLNPQARARALKLAEEGYVDIDSRTFRLTPKGRQALAQEEVAA